MKAKSRTTIIHHDGGFKSYLQERPNGQRVTIVYHQGVRVGCNPYTTTNQDEAAGALIAKYLQEHQQDVSEAEETVEAVSNEAQAWNEQQPS